MPMGMETLMGTEMEMRTGTETAMEMGTEMGTSAKTTGVNAARPAVEVDGLRRSYSASWSFCSLRGE
jgi:hypothetical protein